jgi:hypothetical protein
MAGFFDSLFDAEPTSFFGGDQSSTASASDPTSPPSASGAPPDVLTYPSGGLVFDINTDQPYPRPDRLNMQENIATGAMIKRLAENPNLDDLSNPDLMFAPLFVHGSVMDYQRPFGQPFGQFTKAYKNVSSYNFGAVGGATGYSLERLLNGAALYAKYSGTSSNETPYGLSNEQMNNIAQGFSDFTNGLWTPKQP